MGADGCAVWQISVQFFFFSRVDLLYLDGVLTVMSESFCCINVADELLRELMI
jgi:hypothetical protein